MCVDYVNKLCVRNNISNVIDLYYRSIPYLSPRHCRVTSITLELTFLLFLSFRVPVRVYEVYRNNFNKSPRKSWWRKNTSKGVTPHNYNLRSRFGLELLRTSDFTPPSFISTPKATAPPVKPALRYANNLPTARNCSFIYFTCDMLSSIDYTTNDFDQRYKHHNYAQSSTSYSTPTWP